MKYLEINYILSARKSASLVLLFLFVCLFVRLFVRPELFVKNFLKLLSLSFFKLPLSSLEFPWVPLSSLEFPWAAMYDVHSISDRNSTLKWWILSCLFGARKMMFESIQWSIKWNWAKMQTCFENRKSTVSIFFRKCHH